MKNNKDLIKKHRRHKVEKLDLIQTSVAITRDQKKFIERLDINLSSLLRDILDSLMKRKSGQ